MARAFRARTSTASSSASTRSTVLVLAAVAARDLDLPSRGISSTAIVATSGSRATRAPARAFSSASRKRRQHDQCAHDDDYAIAKGRGDTSDSVTAAAAESSPKYRKQPLPGK